MQQWHHYPVPDTSGDGVLLAIDFFVCLFVCLFVYIFVSLLARLRENGWTDLHEIFGEGAEWPWDNLIKFWVKSKKPRDAATLISFTSLVNITSTWLDRFAWNFQGRCGVTMGRRDSLFGQFGETARCCDANFFVSNITSKPLNRFAWNFQGRCGVTMGWPDYIFDQFRETARCRDVQHGDGVCCAFAPQLVNAVSYYTGKRQCSSVLPLLSLFAGFDEICGSAMLTLKRYDLKPATAQRHIKWFLVVWVSQYVSFCLLKPSQLH